MLLDGDGRLKDFNTFRKDSQTVIADYNVNWLKTEYDAAVKSARTAAMFVDFERDADLYPNNNPRWRQSRERSRRRPSPGLNVNPYYSKAIFSSTHPYVTEAYLPENKLKRILIPLVRKLLKDGK